MTYNIVAKPVQGAPTHTPVTREGANPSMSVVRGGVVATAKTRLGARFSAWLAPKLKVNRWEMQAPGQWVYTIHKSEW